MLPEPTVQIVYLINMVHRTCPQARSGCNASASVRIEHIVICNYAFSPRPGTRFDFAVLADL